MAEPLSNRIFKHIVDRRYVPRQIRQLATELGIADDEYESFRLAIDSMVDEGRVVLGASETIGLPPPGPMMVGTFRLNQRGFGFVIPESPTEHGDLFVPHGNTGGALTGDVVSAKIKHAPRRHGGRSPYVGTVVEILQRADKHYVGNLTQRGPIWIVVVDGQHFHDPIVVRDPHAKGATAGDKVVIELINYPSPASAPGGGGELGEGVIVEVLGKQGEPDIETLAVMRAHGLADQFTPEVLDEARWAVTTFKTADRADREDLSVRFVCTIDPPDARDFDDAVSVERLDPHRDGADYELGVHIADVSHFVRPGSALDQEASARGNSAYLPRKVVPMLPELLSNGVCSLQEGVERLCKSVFLRFDANGQVIDQRFAETTIKSAKRLTYLEAQALIDGDVRAAARHTRSEPNYSQKLIETLGLMDDLAKIIRRRRLDQGMIVLDLPDVELVFDEAGNVVDAEPEDDAFTHTIIEMFMVEANEAAARLFDSLEVPVLRRIHADPPAHDMKDLRQFARIAGYNIPLHPTRKELQALLDAVRGKPAQHAVHLAVLQTLSRAEYAPLHIGHFALASDHYTHFTSPIRRYPDLMVHRGLEAYLAHIAESSERGGREKKKLTEAMRNDDRLPGEQAVAEIGRHCSQTERNAEAAERDLTNYLVLELLSHHLGDDFDGTVTGVTNTGLFVQLDRFLVDGFIHVNELPGGAADRWFLNRTTGALVAPRSGQTITIGNRFTVRIVKVDPVARRLDLVIISTALRGPKTKAKGKRRQPAGARKAHQLTTKMKRRKKRN